MNVFLFCGDVFLLKGSFPAITAVSVFAASARFKERKIKQCFFNETYLVVADLSDSTKYCLYRS